MPCALPPSLPCSSCASQRSGGGGPHAVAGWQGSSQYAVRSMQYAVRSTLRDAASRRCRWQGSPASGAWRWGSGCPRSRPGAAALPGCTCPPGPCRPRSEPAATITGSQPSQLDQPSWSQPWPTHPAPSRAAPPWGAPQLLLCHVRRRPGLLPPPPSSSCHQHPCHRRSTLPTLPTQAPAGWRPHLAVGEAGRSRVPAGGGARARTREAAGRPCEHLSAPVECRVG